MLVIRPREPGESIDWFMLETLIADAPLDDWLPITGYFPSQSLEKIRDSLLETYRRVTERAVLSSDDTAVAETETERIALEALRAWVGVQAVGAEIVDLRKADQG